MERERITISIKKSVLKLIDRTIDGINIRNRSHAIENLTLKGLSQNNDKNAVILMGGKDALKYLAATEQIIKELKRSGYDKIYLAVGFLADKIKAKFGDGSQYKVELDYISEGEGSAGAISPLKKNFASSFLVFNCQTAPKLDLDKFFEYHKKHQAVATVAVEDRKLKNGIYAFEPAVFDYIPKGFSMLEEDVLPKLAQKGELAGYLQFSTSN